MDIFSIFFNIKVCCMFSLESPHRGDSNGYTQYTIFNIKKENHPKLSPINSNGFLFQGTEERVRVVVNEPSVFEPLKFYCRLTVNRSLLRSRFAIGLYSYLSRGNFFRHSICTEKMVTKLQSLV